MSVAQKPEILAPAGDAASFLAALAAGADAVYLGLKHFSARMLAENFSLTELSRLTDLAHAHNRRVYVAMNTLVKPDETSAAWRLAVRLARQVAPDGLIIQDVGMLDLARQAGFEGGLFLSTLANLTHPEALEQARQLGAQRVILPRELSIDEIRLLSAACPPDLGLECFVHGALCFCVSGRCYWSSYMGGKSGLRGRCVQPCRRMYHPAERNTAKSAARTKRQEKKQESRFFSCLDLSLDVLAKTLLDIPHLVSWKIEGRKKGPHYIYHVVTAYRILRDSSTDPAARKMAVELLEAALGRDGTRARFLPQRSASPTLPGGQTSSGLIAGKVSSQDGKIFLKPRLDLLARDYLRLGAEDEPWHDTFPVTRRVPKGGSLLLRLPRHKTPPNGAPVFLIDRREPELLRLLAQWQGKLAALPARPSRAVDGAPVPPGKSASGAKLRSAPPDMLLTSAIPRGRETRPGRKTQLALWLSPRVTSLSRTLLPRLCLWLPPVVWPGEEERLRRLISRLIRDGAGHFVCNAPWQRGFFPSLPGNMRLTAGPFCNVSNVFALGILERMGFTDAFVSPELNREDMTALPRQSPLPLGVVISGYWPVGISRFEAPGVKTDAPFAGPKGEVFWARRYGENLWLYPGWPLDLTEKRQELVAAGYSFFADMQEFSPAGLPQSPRPGLFNWEGALL
ncbi:MAG: U32 family peptidase [Desulfovibrio sp.]|jgi:putative protease|nr:U32 family peptidase [Desulfovibrio sp.]